MKNIKKRYVVIAIVVVYVLLQFITFHQAKPIASKFKSSGFPLVISHGGSKELYPENTVYAFEETMNLGVDVLELDVRMTKDLQLVTHHNETIDETSNGSGLVRDYTYEELKKFNFGYRFKDLEGNYPFVDVENPKLVPITLDELFKKYAKRTLFIVEIKDEGELGKLAANQIKALIEKYDIVEDVNVASFIKENNDYYQTIKDVRSSTSASEDQAKTLVYSMYGGVDFLFNYGVEGVQFPTYQIVPLDTSYLISKLHKHNMFVHYWTINDEKTMLELIDKKVDGIITDRPDLLLKLKQQKTRQN